jgi:hypothetical protein
MTYIFRVNPKQLSRTAAYFSGVIWIDDRDFAVVKTFGRWVTETGDVTPSNLPFNYYETYRTYVTGRYWLPAYTRSDGTMGGGTARVPVRLTLRWEDYRPIPGTTPVEVPQFSSAPTVPAEPPPAAAPPPAASPAPDPERPTLAPRPNR